jgi:hypothetical protein
VPFVQFISDHGTAGYGMDVFPGHAAFVVELCRGYLKVVMKIGNNPRFYLLNRKERNAAYGD